MKRSGAHGSQRIILCLCFVGLVSSALLGQPATTIKPTSPQKPAPSAGLINDWLRQENDTFAAWDLGGQVRLRYEAKDNAGFVANRDFTKNLDNSNDYFLLREKIHVGYTPVSWLNLYVEGRDASSHSDKRNPSPDEDIFDLHQAAISFGDAKKLPMLLKIGRQELLYGDERFIGIGDWSNTGRSFDAAKLRFENDSLWLDAFSGRVVVPHDNHFNESNDYDLFSGLYASTRKLLPWQETQLYFLARNVGVQAPNASATGVPGTPTSARDIYTVGMRFKSLPGKFDGWDYSAEIAGQFGSVVQTGIRRDLEALATDATIGYSWTKTFGSPRLGIGYTYASGDDSAADGKSQTFEPLFGTNHKFYGLMDLWGLRNIHSGRVVASIKPLKQLTLLTECHLIWLADTADFFFPESGGGRTGNGYGRNPQFDSFVGSELNLLATYSPTSYADVQLGYGHFFVG